MPSGVSKEAKSRGEYVVSLKTGDTPLLKACRSKKSFDLETLLESLPYSCIIARNWRCRTSLHITAQIVPLAGLKTRFLLDAGAEIDARCPDHLIPLHMAAMFNNLDAAKELLNRGADVSLQSISGRIPIHVAAESGSIEIFRELLREGADVSIQDKKGGSPLHFAARFNKINIVREFAENFASYINAKNKLSRTSLYLAVEEDHVEVFVFLLERGAKDLDDSSRFQPYQITNLNAHDCKGESCISSCHYVAYRSFTDVRKQRW